MIGKVARPTGGRHSIIRRVEGIGAYITEKARECGGGGGGGEEGTEPKGSRR